MFRQGIIKVQDRFFSVTEGLMQGWPFFFFVNYAVETRDC